MFAARDSILNSCLIEALHFDAEF